MTRLKVIKVTIQYFDKGSQLSNTSQNSVNVRTWEGRLPVQKQGCITPCEEDRELLVQMSDSLTPILPSLPCLCLFVCLFKYLILQSPILCYYLFVGVVDGLGRTMMLASGARNWTVP